MTGFASIYYIFFTCNILKKLGIFQINIIFEVIAKNLECGWNYSVEASFLEVYKKRIVDLLDSKDKDHKIIMADNGGCGNITNLKVEKISSLEMLKQHLKTAQKKRATAGTHVHARYQSKKKNFNFSTVHFFTFQQY